MWNDSHRLTGSPAGGPVLEEEGHMDQSLGSGAQFHVPFALCFPAVSTTWPATSGSCRLPSPPWQTASPQCTGQNQPSSPELLIVRHFSHRNARLLPLSDKSLDTLLAVIVCSFLIWNYRHTTLYFLGISRRKPTPCLQLSSNWRISTRYREGSCELC